MVAIYAKALAEKGHDVVLVSVPQKSIPLRRKIKSFITGNGWPSESPSGTHLDGLGLDHRVMERWRPVTDRDVPDADVVIATWWETAEWVASLSDSKGAKVYFIQGHEVFPHCPKERVKATYRLPLHKITISNWLLELMQNEYEDNNVDLIQNSVDHKMFYSSPRAKQVRPTVGLLYSNKWVKGVDASFSALGILAKKYPNLRVLSFGSSEPDAKLPLPDFVEFQKLPPQDKLRDIYSSCDVWLCGSRTEGFHLPPAEAMACRTPVVSTRVGGPTDLIVDGVNGVLVDVDDEEGLASGMEWVLGLSDEKWIDLSNRAYETVASNSWDKCAILFERALIDASQRN